MILSFLAFPSVRAMHPHEFTLIPHTLKWMWGTCFDVTKNVGLVRSLRDFPVNGS